MAQVDPAIGHLLRRAGFGISTDKATFWNQQGVTALQAGSYAAPPPREDGAVLA